MASTDGQTASSPRLSLRTAASPKRNSAAGNLGVSSPKAAPAAARIQGGARLSSPGMPGSPNANGPSSPVLSNSGDLPRLPRVSDTGDRLLIKPGHPGTMLRRSSTMSTAAMTREVLNSLPASIPEGARRKSNVASEMAFEGGQPGENAMVVKKERNSLRQEKAALLQNKRRLEGLINRLLELQPGQEGEGGSGNPPGRPPLTRGSTMRAQLLKALDESAGLEKQLNGGGGGGGGGGGESSISPKDADARVRELTAKMVEMQSDHDVAVSRLEGELSYRRTQAAASTGHLSKQLGEAEEELKDTRRQLATAEERIRGLTHQTAEMRMQLNALDASLGRKSQELKDLRDMLGMDKATMQTVIEMLKEQLYEANSERQQRAQLIMELEYAVVHRDTLLAEAHERMNAAAAQAAAAAVGASSAAAATSAVAVARVSASGVSATASRDARSAWSALAKTVTSRGRGFSNGSISGAQHTMGMATRGSEGGSGVKGRAAGDVSAQNSYGADGFEPDDGEE